jgi:hypothetical protein
LLGRREAEPLRVRLVCERDDARMAVLQDTRMVTSVRVRERSPLPTRSLSEALLRGRASDRAREQLSR